MYMYILSESVNRRVVKDTDIHYADPFVKFELEALAVSTCFTLTIVHSCRHAVVPWLFFTRVTRPVNNPECSVHGKSFTQAQVKMESSKWLFVRERPGRTLSGASLEHGSSMVSPITACTLSALTVSNP